MCLGIHWNLSKFVVFMFDLVSMKKAHVFYKGKYFLDIYFFYIVQLKRS
jgi:hypothetical protein